VAHGNEPYTETQLALVHAAVVKAIADRDAEAFSLLYEPDAALIPGGSIIQGRDRIRQTFADWLDQGFCGQTVTLHALLSSGDVALEVGTARGVFSADQKTVATSNYTIVHRRQPTGEWLMVWDAWSPAAVE
jgi:conserved hypothetical protein